MRAMQLNHFILQILALIRGEPEFLQVITPHAVRIVIAQFGLDQIRAQQRMRDERARQSVV